MKLNQVCLPALAFVSLASSAALPSVGVSDVANQTLYENVYCTFYSDSACTQQVGGSSYDVFNDGCFQNDGGYIHCSGPGSNTDFLLVQSPQNTNNCNCQNNCRAFPSAGNAGSPYDACTPIDLTPGYTAFRIEHDMSSCAANNC